MTVRLRLALWNALILVLAIGGLGGILRFKVRSDMTEGIRSELIQRAERFDIFFRPDRPGTPHPSPRIERIERKAGATTQPPPRRFRPNDLMGPRVFTPTGVAIIPDDTRPPFDPVAINKAHASGEKLMTRVRVPEESDLLVYTIPHLHTPFADNVVLQYSQTLAPVDNAMRRLTDALWTMLPIAFLVAIAGAAFLTDRALRPVAAVTQAAAEIGEHDLSRRLPVSGKDEFARLSETLNGMLSRLETAFDRERRFAADASHELKSPLTVIKANSSLALTDTELSKDARLALTEIDAAADRTTRIVQDLLLLARSDAGDLTPRRSLFPVRPLFEDIIRDACRLPDAAPIRIGVPETIFLNADREQVRRLMTNLTENALRHTPSTGIVTLSARTHGGGTLLIVTDTGEGIAAEHLPRLGERFYRPDAARTRMTGGSGLGLSICRAIVEAHGGTMKIESELGGGTCVTAIFS
jgi:signal transduction histidine kinase